MATPAPWSSGRAGFSELTAAGGPPATVVRGPSALHHRSGPTKDEDVEELMAHQWKLTFETREDEDHCEMVVHLDAGDRSLSGRGRSRRNPADPSVPQVGEELAAARALHDLANHLTEDAWRTIESFPNGDN